MDNSLSEESLVKKINEVFHKLYYDTDKYSNLLLNPDDKRTARMWLDKLGTYEAITFNDADLRNEILHWLMQCCAIEVITEPFDREPEDIIDLKELNQLRERCGLRTSPGFFEISPENSAFPMEQPVIRSGVFCYIALINRTPSDKL